MVRRRQQQQMAPFCGSFQSDLQYPDLLSRNQEALRMTAGRWYHMQTTYNNQNSILEDSQSIELTETMRQSPSSCLFVQICRSTRLSIGIREHRSGPQAA